MTIENLTSFIGISLPLIAIAGTAVAFVFQIYVDASQRRRNHFFELMALIDTDGTIASKLAAFYQLRDFPEHKDFIVNFCTSQMQGITGPAAQDLADEMQRTIDHFSK